jgi:hypothetical protein
MVSAPGSIAESPLKPAVDKVPVIQGDGSMPTKSVRDILNEGLSFKTQCTKRGTDLRPFEFAEYVKALGEDAGYEVDLMNPTFTGNQASVVFYDAGGKHYLGRIKRDANGDWCVGP